MKDRLFYEWLAGQLDGDGCFYLCPKGYPAITITTHTLDLCLLYYVEDTLGYGNIYKKINADAHRLVVYKKSQVIELLNNLNGLIYNSVKFSSFSKMCIHYGITPIVAPIPSRLSPYYAGFFDADGTIGCYLDKGGYPTVTVSVKNKYKVDVLLYQTTFGGKMGEEKGLSFRWYASNKADISAFLDYYKSVGHFQSFKSTKFLLIEEFFELKDMRAHKPYSIHRPRWDIHYAKWRRKRYDD